MKDLDVYFFMQKMVCANEFSAENYKGVCSCPDLQQITKSASFFQIKATRTIQKRQEGDHTSLPQ